MIVTDWADKILAGPIKVGKQLGFSKDYLTQKETDQYVRAVKAKLADTCASVELATVTITLQGTTMILQNCTLTKEATVAGTITLPVLVLIGEGVVTLAHAELAIEGGRRSFIVQDVFWNIPVGEVSLNITSPLSADKPKCSLGGNLYIRLGNGVITTFS